MLDIKLFETQQNRPEYMPSNEDQIKVDFVKNRISVMQQNRSSVDKDRNTYQTMIDAVFVPYPDERSSSVVPL
jgi:hypothetical protein